MKLPQKKQTYTTTDGIKRKFKPFYWPDMIRLGELFPHINQMIPGINFLQFAGIDEIDKKVQTDAAKNYQALIDVFEILFSEKNCDLPLTLEQIEKGDIIT